MSFELGSTKIKVRHAPADIVLQAPWGDAILYGEVTETGEDTKDTAVGDHVNFARRDGYLINEGEEEENWIVDESAILENEPAT